MPIHWHIDGKGVKLHDDWEATITSAGGYEQLTATVEREEVLHAHQGSHISGETEGGHQVWYGTLDATPAISRHPVAHITATGPVARVRRQRGNRLYQSRDYSLWSPITSDPHNYTAIGTLNVAQSISADAQTGRFVYAVADGTDIKQNDANGLCAWFMSEPVTRVAFDWTVLTGTSSYALRVYTGTGPSGTLTQRGSFVSGAGASGSEDLTLSAGNDDLIALVLYRSGANTTTTANNWLRVGNLRVNGRTLGDSLPPGQIIADFGSAVGWKTGGVKSSGANALPYYWQGGSWGDAIDELAVLDDWPWLALKDSLTYNPWDVKWELRFPQDSEDIDFPPIYNAVRVFYTTMAGAARSVKLTANPDPLARFGDDNEFQYDLSQSYSSDTIPTDVAGALLERVSVQRVVGTVTVTKIDTNQRVWTPTRHFTVGSDERVYHILPGDMGDLEPYPKLPPQRITAVRMHANDVQVEFGDSSETSAVRELARLAGQRARMPVSLRKKK